MKINKFTKLNERMDFSNPISIENILEENPDCKLHNIDKKHDNILNWEKAKFVPSCAIYVYVCQDLYLFVHATKGPIHIVFIHDSYNFDYVSQRFIIVGHDSIAVLDTTRNEIEEFHYR